MEADAKITRTIGTDTVLLSGKFNTRLTCIGSSCTVSANPGDQVDSFSVSPWNDVGWDVVAVRTSEFKSDVGKHGIYEFNHFLLLITMHDGRPWVELKKPFVPDRNHFGQIIPDAGLSVRIGNEFFLAPVLALTEDRIAKLRTTYRLVPNDQANLLCKFIAGTATADEVKAVAEAEKKEVLEVDALRLQLEEATQRATELQSELDRALERSQVVRRRLEECERKGAAQTAQNTRELHAFRVSVAEKIDALKNAANARPPTPWWVPRWVGIRVATHLKGLLEGMKKDLAL